MQPSSHPAQLLLFAEIFSGIVTTPLGCAAVWFLGVSQRPILGTWSWLKTVCKWYWMIDPSLPKWGSWGGGSLKGGAEWEI